MGCDQFLAPCGSTEHRKSTVAPSIVDGAAKQRMRRRRAQGQALRRVADGCAGKQVQKQSRPGGVDRALGNRPMGELDGE